MSRFALAVPVTKTRRDIYLFRYLNAVSEQISVVSRFAPAAPHAKTSRDIISRTPEIHPARRPKRFDYTAMGAKAETFYSIFTSSSVDQSRIEPISPPAWILPGPGSGGKYIGQTKPVLSFYWKHLIVLCS